MHEAAAGHQADVQIGVGRTGLKVCDDVVHGTHEYGANLPHFMRGTGTEPSHPKLVLQDVAAAYVNRPVRDVREARLPLADETRHERVLFGPFAASHVFGREAVGKES